MIRFLLLLLLLQSCSINKDSFSIYTNDDILHVEGLKISFETNNKQLTFNTLTDRNDFIENKTAADTKGVDFIRYMAETGEIFIRADENKSALMYNGKYWDGKIWADTMFTISVFTDIEKIYYPDEDRIEYDIKYMK